MGYEDCIGFLKSRRSIRRFKQDPVGDDLVLKILDVARFAPSAKNRQPWEFVVVKDPEVRGRLAGIHVYASPLRGAPLAIVVVGDRELSPVSYQVDCANATIYLMLAAHALGLGTVWIQALRNGEEIRRILGLPENKAPVAIVAMGWPDEKPKARGRKELSEIVHLDRYGNRMIKS